MGEAIFNLVLLGLKIKEVPPRFRLIDQKKTCLRNIRLVDRPFFNSESIKLMQN